MESLGNLQNLDWKTLIVGSLLTGGVMGSVITAYATKFLERYFGFLAYKDETLRKRYELIYCRLIYKLMDVEYFRDSKPSLKKQIPIIKAALLNKKWSTAWYLAKKIFWNCSPWMLSPDSKFTVLNIKSHIEKYGQYADAKLVELLSIAVATENLQYEIEPEAYLDHYQTRVLPKEVYKLLKYIEAQHKKLNKRLSHS